MLLQVNNAHVAELFKVALNSVAVIRTAVSQWRPCATAECYHVATDRTLCNQCTILPNGRNVANGPNGGARGLPARSRVSYLQEGAPAVAAPSTTPAVADSVAAAAAAAAARAKANAGLGQLCSSSTAEAINSISIEDLVRLKSTTSTNGLSSATQQRQYQILLSQALRSVVDSINATREANRAAANGATSRLRTTKTVQQQAFKLLHLLPALVFGRQPQSKGYGQKSRLDAVSSGAFTALLASTLKAARTPPARSAQSRRLSSPDGPFDAQDRRAQSRRCTLHGHYNCGKKHLPLMRVLERNVTSTTGESVAVKYFPLSAILERFLHSPARVRTVTHCSSAHTAAPAQSSAALGNAYATALPTKKAAMYSPLNGHLMRANAALGIESIRTADGSTVLVGDAVRAEVVCAAAAGPSNAVASSAVCKVLGVYYSTTTKSFQVILRELHASSAVEPSLDSNSSKRSRCSYNTNTLPIALIQLCSVTFLCNA
jgi:hypothetical protein